MFWVNTVFTTTLPLLRIFRQIKPFTEHQYGIIKCPLCIVLYGLRTTPLFLSLPLTHTLAHAWLVHHMWAEVWALRRLLYDDSRWDLLIPSPMGLCKPLCNIRQKTLNQSVESAQCVCLTSPCSCHQWPGAGRHVSLPYPPVSYHSFICPQGMAALPKTTTHACSRRALFYSSQHPQRKSDIPNCSPKAVVLFMVASQSCFSTLTFKYISTIMIIYIKQRFKKWIYL